MGRVRKLRLNTNPNFNQIVSRMQPDQLDPTKDNREINQSGTTYGRGPSMPENETNRCHRSKMAVREFCQTFRRIR
jgi:hypothetical protein